MAQFFVRFTYVDDNGDRKDFDTPLSSESLNNFVEAEEAFNKAHPDKEWINFQIIAKSEPTKIKLTGYIQRSA